MQYTEKIWGNRLVDSGTITSTHRSAQYSLFTHDQEDSVIKSFIAQDQMVRLVALASAEAPSSGLACPIPFLFTDQ